MWLPGEDSTRMKGISSASSRSSQGVASSEPSSTTSQTSGGRVWAARARAVRSMFAASLRTGLISSRRSPGWRS